MRTHTKMPTAVAPSANSVTPKEDWPFEQLQDEAEELRARLNRFRKSLGRFFVAKQELIDVINRINTQTQEMFVDTFNRIRENFQSMFTEVFGGGKADLRLVNEGDVLESGIDIVARPPGTDP